VLGGCDVAKPEPPRAIGPNVHLVAANPRNGFGNDCEPGEAGCGFPTNGTLSFRFDRFLNPTTTSRQAIVVYTGDPSTSPSFDFAVRYDPVERVLQYALKSGYAYEPNTLYNYELFVAEEPGANGIRSFDGAPLEEQDVPLRGSFLTGTGPGKLPVHTAPSCAEIVTEIFGTSPADCSSSKCHSSLDAEPGAPHGLWLDSRANFQVTAVNRVARQTEVGDRSGGVPLELPLRFGVEMPLVDATGSPGNSYLLYKLLLSPGAYEACAFDATSSRSIFCGIPADVCESAYLDLPFAGRDCIAPPDAELERLREWFVRGEPMPIPRPVERAVGLQQVRAISSFISAGADCGQ
jgi:hypothetical protein